MSARIIPFQRPAAPPAPQLDAATLTLLLASRPLLLAAVWWRAWATAAEQTVQLIESWSTAR